MKSFILLTVSLFLFFRTLTGSISELEEKKGITHGFLEPKDITITGALYDEDKVAMLLNPPKTNDLSLRDYKHLYFIGRDICWITGLGV